MGEYTLPTTSRPEGEIIYSIDVLPTVWTAEALAGGTPFVTSDVPEEPPPLPPEEPKRIKFREWL
jgi:hypothetical protein